MGALTDIDTTLAAAVGDAISDLTLTSSTLRETNGSFEIDGDEAADSDGLIEGFQRLLLIELLATGDEFSYLNTLLTAAGRKKSSKFKRTAETHKFYRQRCRRRFCGTASSSQTEIDTFVNSLSNRKWNEISKTNHGWLRLFWRRACLDWYRWAAVFCRDRRDWLFGHSEKRILFQNLALLSGVPGRVWVWRQHGNVTILSDYLGFVGILRDFWLSALPHGCNNDGRRESRIKGSAAYIVLQGGLELVEPAGEAQEPQTFLQSHCWCSERY